MPKENKHSNHPPAHIHPRATETLNLRILPEMRSWIEDEAAANGTSMTKVALSAFDLLYAAKQRQSKGANWLYW
jgi:uncharacterized protein (DUF1778 family)